MSLCVGLAFALHPANIARRYPSVPDRGWWPYLQFLTVWFPVLALWLYLVDESAYLLIEAAGFAFFGWFFGSLPGTEDLYTKRSDR